MTPELLSLAKMLRISVISSGKLNVSSELSGEDYLLEVFRAERAARDERLTKERIRQARLPAFKSFDEFDTEFQKGVTKKQLELLPKLEWVDGLYNLILIGPPGS